MELKDKIIEYRAKHNISQEEFGRRCGLTKQTVYSIENGLQDPSKVTRVKIELLLKKDEEEE